jgi:hypothetical protein
MKEAGKCPHCGAEIARGPGVKQYYCLNCGAALDEKGEGQGQGGGEVKLGERGRGEGTTMKVVRRVGVLSVANIYGLVMVFLGLIYGLVYAFLGFAVEKIGDMEGFGFGLGFFIIIVLPIAYGALGWIFGLIGAALYNWVARLIGGVRIELE